MKIELNKRDLQLLAQSLDHCLATCTKKGEGKADTPCDDCNAASALNQRIKMALQSAPKEK